jgi:hypothetical protein
MHGRPCPNDTLVQFMSLTLTISYVVKNADQMKGEKKA